MDTVKIAGSVLFLSTLSLRRATGIGLVFLWWGVRFLSTLSLRRATKGKSQADTTGAISIHALLAESDVAVVYDIVFMPGFLSTLSLRRATCRNGQNINRGHNFYPRSPCGERQSSGNSCTQALPISIHALLAESDSVHPETRQHDAFLSTLSLRRATAELNIRQIQKIISIHALLAESDYTMTTTICIASKFLSTLSLRRATLNQIPPRRFHYHFYPRSPCGERLTQADLANRAELFLSTLSLRRATTL